MKPEQVKKLSLGYYPTPLQRMTGTCLFFLYSSGCTTLVPGMRKADAECLSAKLTHGGTLL